MTRATPPSPAAPLAPRPVTRRTARRLAVVAQGLAGPRPVPDRAAIIDVVRRIGCLQLDPTNVVARSHLLVLWSRLGAYDVADVAALVEEDRALFEYWAHEASLVLSEDYPLHHLLMRTWPRTDGGVWGARVRSWLEVNDSFRRYIRSELRRRGPLPATEIEDRSVVPWDSTGWTNARNVSRMLDLMSFRGEALVSARRGGRRLWDIGERCVPAEMRRERLSDNDIVRRCVLRAVQALGIARARDIPYCFTRGRYPDLPNVVSSLEKSADILRCTVDGMSGDWFVPADDLALLDAIERGEWRPRTTLLSPFDNLICDRARTEALWDFRFRLEIYTPAAKREYGYFVLPVLDGDRLIARADMAQDRKRGALVVKALHAEPDAPRGAAAARRTAAAIESLATFVGANTLDYGKVPDTWPIALRA